MNYAEFLSFATNLALSGYGRTDPNPSVGAVIIDEEDMQVLGVGVTQRSGYSHAEIVAMENAEMHYQNGICEGKTLVVTMEPCNHTGKTGPCTEQIVLRKFAKVVIAARDVNPQVAGGGIRALEAAGIEVELLPEEPKEIQFALESFRWSCENKQAMGILKWAQDSNGFLAPKKGPSGQISSPEAREFMHRLRAMCGTVLGTPGSVASDAPQLNPRYGKLGLKIPECSSPWVRSVENMAGPESWGAPPLRSRQVYCLPSRWGAGKIKKFMTMRSDLSQFQPIFIARSEKSWKAISNWTEHSRCWQSSKIDFSELAEYLHVQVGINQLMIEAGPEASQDLLTEKFIKHVIIFENERNLFAKGRGNDLSLWLAKREDDQKTFQDLTLVDKIKVGSDHIYFLERVG